VKKIALVIFVLIGFTSLACGVKPGFKALAIYDYFKAKHKFEKAPKSDLAAASFGLAQIYYRSDNPFHDFYKAYHQMRISDSAFLVAKIRKKEKWNEYGVNAMEIIALQQKISQGLYSFTKNQNSILAYQNFIDSNAWSIEIHDAIKRRDVLEFSNAKVSGKSIDLNVFIKLRPSSHLYNEALELFYKLEYKELTISGTTKEYASFVQNHSVSPYYNLAQDELYKNETSMHTLISYADFIKNYPLNRNVDSAWRLLYDKYTSNYTAENIEAFQKAYPEYPFQSEIEEELKLMKERFLPFKRNGLWGFSDDQEAMKIEPQFAGVSSFAEGLAMVEKDGLYGFINKMGVFVIPAIYDEAESFSDGLAIVVKSGQLGVIDRSGQAILDFGLEDVSKPIDGLFYADKKDGYRFYNSRGIEYYGGVYEEINDFDGETAIVAKDDFYGVIKMRPSFSYVIEPKYSDIKRFGSNYRCASDSGVVVLNVSGDTISKNFYDYIADFSENLAYVEKDGFYGFIDTNYNLALPIKFPVYTNSRNLTMFKNGSSRNVVLNKMGLIDKAGKKLAPAIFNYIGYFDSLIPITKDGLWGFCNKKIDKVIEYQFDHALPFEKNHSIVELNGKSGLINVLGAFVIQPEYDKMYRKDGMILARKGNTLWYLFDEKGKLLTEIGCQTVRKVDKDMYLLERAEESTLFKLKQ
jgi:hypothetical protein